MYHYRVFSVISLRDISFFLFKITRGISDPCPLSSYDNNFIFFPSTIHSKRLYSAIFFIEKFNPGKILLLKSSESSDHPRETSVRKLFKFYFEIPLLVSPFLRKIYSILLFPYETIGVAVPFLRCQFPRKSQTANEQSCNVAGSLTCKSAPPRMHAFSHAPRINLRVRVRSQEACANVCHATEKYRFSTRKFPPVYLDKWVFDIRKITPS